MGVEVVQIYRVYKRDKVVCMYMRVLKSQNSVYKSFVLVHIGIRVLSLNSFLYQELMLLIVRAVYN